jgi:hypothetical protein
MSNEWHDIAALNTSRTDGAGERSARATLLSQILTGCVVGRPDLADMGWRAWWLCEAAAPGSLPRVNGRDRQQLRRVAREGAVMMRVQALDMPLTERQRVVEIVLGGEVLPRKLGRRVTLLAYAFERGDAVRAVLPSFESIGGLWGLTAKNQRSAVCAAMDKTVRQMVERGQLRQRHYERLSELWFAKKRVTRERCEKAQIGNHNRLASVDDLPTCAAEQLKAEHAERIDGVPVQAKYAEMTPLELRRYLQGLHDQAELRRLGI